MKCISCGNLNFKPLKIYNPQNKKETFIYNFCQKCGLGIINLDLNKDYSSNYDEEYFEYQESTSSFLTRFIELFSLTREEFVLKYRIGINSILDIGCGVGSFLNNLKNHFKQLSGTELNENAKKIALSKNKEIKIIDNRLLILDKYDVVTMWHVLEHINDPLNFLDNIKKNLHNNSTLFIEVPNNNSWNFRIFKKNYNWISVPEHLFFYNEKSLINIFDKLDFKIIKIYYPRQFPLLFSSHFSNLFIKIITIPVSIVFFFISPFFKGTESIRFCIKIK